MGWTLLAEMLHVPLGMLGLGAVCMAAVGLLRLQDKGQGTGSKKTSRSLARPVWLTPALATVILALGLVYAPRPHVGLAEAADSTGSWDFPAGLLTEPQPLRPDEVGWLTRDGAASAKRLRFEWHAANGEHNISGSMMLITSRTWRAQHRPERCFEVYGLSLNESRVHLVEPDFPVRLVSLGDDQGRQLASASYWFQSAERTTADYGTRIWADLSLERVRWVLVTILFDGARDLHSADVESFYAALHEAVERKLNESW